MPSIWRDLDYTADVVGFEPIMFSGRYSKDQKIAAHERLRTKKLHRGADDKLTPGEIEKISV